MNDMERRKFEESFKEAFKDAQVQPSDKVWTNVELDLIKAEGEKMKRRIFFYQMLAAASISFAVIFAGLGFYALQENREQRIALNKYNEEAIGNQQKNLSQAPESEQRSGSERNQGGAVSEGTSNDDTYEPVNDGKISGSENALADANEQRRPNNTVQSSRELSNSKDLNRTQQGEGILSDPSGTEGFRAGNEISPTDVAVAESSSPESDPALSREAGSLQMGDDSQSRQELMNKNSSIAGNETTGAQIVTDQQEENQIAVNQRTLPALYRTAEPELVFAKEEIVEADPVALMFARLNDLEKELARAGNEKNKSNSKEKLWTSVGFAAGAFNAISGQAAPQPAQSFAMTNNSAAQNQTRASGVAYSMGINMGTRIAERWVVQGGVNYLTEMSDYTSTQAVQESGTFKAASVNQFRTSSSSTDATEKFIPTAPYTVNNSNEYLSIPLQAGYLIIKRKIQWQLNAGVSTDLFLQNTVDPEGNIAKTTSGAGDDSPFRTVNFSGLVGSEVSYRFGDRYRLGLNPGLRYPLNSIYKDNLGLESSPLTFDIGLRFRYIFK